MEGAASIIARVGALQTIIQLNQPEMIKNEDIGVLIT